MDDRRRYRRDEDGVLRVVAVINGVEGYWSKFTESCSGCFEPGDYAGLAHHYPYDTKHHCHVGAGCSECGYTGKRVERFFVPFDLKDCRRLGEESPVRDLVGRLLRAPKHYCSDLEREHVTIAAALREAYEAGCRSVYPVPSCPECGISGACIEEDGICPECGWRVPGVEQFEDS